MVYSNQASSGVISWNASLDNLEFTTYNQETYKTYLNTNNINGISYSKFLTNSPSSGTIRDDENAWLSILAPSHSNTGRYDAIVTTYDSTNSVLQTVKIRNAEFIQTYYSNDSLRFPVGTNNLNDIPSSGIITGSQPIITASVDKYSVYVVETFNPTYRLTEYKWFLVDDTCTKNDTYRFHFLNKLGGWDTFTFIRGHKKKSNIERSTYKSNNNVATSSTYSYSVKDFSSVDYNTKLSESINVISDWVSEETYEWLYELISSPQVYLDDSTYGLVAINITNNSYEFKTDSQDKIFNISLDFKYSSDNYRQKR
jgi:hypothetical protein